MLYSDQKQWRICDEKLPITINIGHLAESANFKHGNIY